LVLEDDGGGFRCSSGSGDSSGDSGDDGWPSFKRWLDSGGLDSAGQQRELRRLWWLGLGQNSHGDNAIYRGKSHELVAEVDYIRSYVKILTKSQRSELDLKGRRISCRLQEMESWPSKLALT
jgi:hypothetical protein